MIIWANKLKEKINDGNFIFFFYNYHKIKKNKKNNRFIINYYTKQKYVIYFSKHKQTLPLGYKENRQDLS